MIKRISQQGAILTLILVFGGIFVLLLGGLSSLFFVQYRNAKQKAAYFASLAIAEAGIDYYRWHLAHAPDDFQDGAGGVGPYVHQYQDPEGGTTGTFSLEITLPSSCEQSIAIKSTGFLNEFPSIKRTAAIKYVKPSLAKYGFLTNSNVWFGENEELKGEFHSNGGIRMDGEQNGLSSSVKQTYICGPEHGCNPAQEKPGIWGQGEGGEEGLWKFPVPSIDFQSILQDLSQIKSQAQSAGLYLGNLGLGYHIKFKNNGTFDVFRVKKLKQKVWGYDGQKWVHETNDIEEEDFFQNYSISAGCGPIFIEDNVWVDGEVNGRVTLAAARLPENPGTDAKIIIGGNITYANNNSILGLIGQKDILIPLWAPNNLEIQAAMLAQKGHIFRYYYPPWDFEPYKTYALRENIETFGSIITNTMWTFSWVDAGGDVISGYKNTEMSYDPKLTAGPPPYFPVSGQYQSLEWEEVQ